MQRRVAPGHPWYEIGNQENERYDFRAIAKNLEQNPPYSTLPLGLGDKYYNPAVLEGRLLGGVTY